ncbi:alpha/beta hydrolase family protein [Nonomuraea basaltis]|uniref:alpha/beta hydrolase family protein n=1 Tax=Nonomuraea basaltis TaxID=2495887 RepID=UPI0014860651|nr:carboxylic ester hydrolase [Nonomuraea basaltis]
MRPFEIVLLVADVVAFVVLVIPPRGRVEWLRHAALVPPAAMAAHLLVEGPRWQMIPAYGLGLAFAFAGGRLLRGVRAPGRRRWPRLFGAGLGVLGLVVSAALPAALPIFGFPEPTGPYDVGTLTYHWVDADRPEIFTAAPDDRRELMVQIWYPAEADPSAPRAPYIEDAAIITPTLGRLLGVPGFTFSHLGHVRTNAVPSAPVADGELRYPVLIMLAGIQGYRQVYTFKVEELASQGYVVAAIGQPYAHAAVLFPDGRQVAYDHRLDDRAFEDTHIPHLSQDVGTTLDRLTALDLADPHGVLTGRLDLSRVGLTGQSLGAIVGSQACLAEPRLRACLLEDGYMTPDAVRSGLRQPTMWITRDAEVMRLERRRAGGWTEADIAEHQNTMRAVYESLPTEGYFVLVDGIFHLDMTDGPLFAAPPLAAALGLSGPIGGSRAHAVTNAYSVAFFDHQLKGTHSPLLDGPSRQYPEVRIERHLPHPDKE